MNGTLRGLAVVTALAAAVPTAAQDRYVVGGNDVAVYNLAGEVAVTGGGSGDVVVEVMRGGRDGGELGVQVGEIAGRQTLRVLYPSDEVSYTGSSWRGSTNLRVREDGTWGGDDNWFGRGDRVRVSTRGGGLEAHADLRVRVPEGQRIAIYLAVGRITAENVNGTILLDTHAGGVAARGMAGYLNVDTGSGSVEVLGMDGDLEVDTGSGSVRVADVTAGTVEIDTGSGRVQADAVAARRLAIDTGSGSIGIRRSSAADLRLDTGSGSVDADLTSDIERLLVDTGSGSVTLRLPSTLSATLDIETGSGGIDVEFPVAVTRRARDELRGTVGDGRGSIRVDTGSGSVRIQRQ